VTLALGLVLIIAVWVAVPTLGNGTPKPWLWSTGSWQAVATGLTGYALAVFASLQVAISRRTWRTEQIRLVEQRRQDILISLTESDISAQNIIAAMKMALARRQLNHPEMDHTDMTEAIKSIEDTRKRIPGLREELTDPSSLPELEKKYGAAAQVRTQISALESSVRLWTDG